MKTIKKLLNHIFIDGMSGMASGLFATLIIGTILTQIGTAVAGFGGALTTVGDMIFMMGKVASALTGAGIGVAVAVRLKMPLYVVVSAATAGMTGAFAAKILGGIEGIEIFSFTDRDVVRHHLVRKIIAAYDGYERERAEKKNEKFRKDKK